MLMLVNIQERKERIQCLHSLRQMRQVQTDMSLNSYLYEQKYSTENKAFKIIIPLCFIALDTLYEINLLKLTRSEQSQHSRKNI